MTGDKPQSRDSNLQWRRAVVEGVVIVLSILLAFAIDAAWDEFKERRQERAFLASLHSDFQAARGLIDEGIVRHQTFIDSAQRLLDHEGGPMPDAETAALETALGAVFFDWGSLYLPSGSRDALFASGDIEIVSNEQLRALLAGFPTRVADAAEDERWIANDVMNHMAPYLHQKIRTRNVSRLTNPNATELLPPLESVDYEALWSDPRFDNLIAYRILNETYVMQEFRWLGEAVDEIILTIETELGR